MVFIPTIGKNMTIIKLRYVKNAENTLFFYITHTDFAFSGKDKI